MLKTKIPSLQAENYLVCVDESNEFLKALSYACKSAKKNKNGGFKRWCVRKGKKETQKFTGDGLPF